MEYLDGGRSLCQLTSRTIKVAAIEIASDWIIRQTAGLFWFGDFNRAFLQCERSFSKDEPIRFRRDMRIMRFYRKKFADFITDLFY